VEVTTLSTGAGSFVIESLISTRSQPTDSLRAQQLLLSPVVNAFGSSKSILSPLRRCEVWEANLSRAINRVYLKIYGVTDFPIRLENIGQAKMHTDAFKFPKREDQLHIINYPI